MRQLRPVKNFAEYEKLLEELDELEEQGKEDTRGFRDRRNLIRKFEKPFIEESENPKKEEPQPE